MGAWSSVLFLSEVVFNLSGSLRKASFVDVSHVFWDVVDKPVDEVSTHAIWVITAQSKTFGSIRHLFPRKLGRNVLSVACELRGNVAAVLKIATLQSHDE